MPGGVTNRAGSLVVFLAGMLGGIIGAVIAPWLWFAAFHLTAGGVFVFGTMGVVLGLLLGLCLGLPAWWAGAKLPSETIRSFLHYVAAGTSFCTAAFSPGTVCSGGARRRGARPPAGGRCRSGAPRPDPAFQPTRPDKKTRWSATPHLSAWLFHRAG